MGQVGQWLDGVGHGAAKRKVMDVEALLQWAYGEERVHEARDPGRVRWVGGTGLSNTGVIMRVLELGTMVQGGGGSGAPEVVPARDALAVDALVLELPEDVRGVVISCAIHGSRPETYAGVARQPKAVTRGKHGRAVVVYADERRRHPLYCPLEYSPSDGEIVSARGAYSRWWVALDWLATYLPDVLQDHEIRGFQAPREPWA